jgi:hypothetical protein
VRVSEWNLARQSAKASGALREGRVWRGGTGGSLPAQRGHSASEDNGYVWDASSGAVKAVAAAAYCKGGERRDTSLALAACRCVTFARGQASIRAWPPIPRAQSKGSTQAPPTAFAPAISPRHATDQEVGGWAARGQTCSNTGSARRFVEAPVFRAFWDGRCSGDGRRGCGLPEARGGNAGRPRLLS